MSLQLIDTFELLFIPLYIGSQLIICVVENCYFGIIISFIVLRDLSVIYILIVFGMLLNQFLQKQPFIVACFAENSKALLLIIIVLIAFV